MYDSIDELYWLSFSFTGHDIEIKEYRLFRVRLNEFDGLFEPLLGLNLLKIGAV